MKAIGILACLFVAVGTGVLLVTGSEWIDWELPFAFPAGNLIAAAMLVAAAAIPVLMGAPGPKRRRFAKLVFRSAVAWLPVSMALAGGTQLSYSGVPGWIWMAYTLALLAAIPVALAWAVVAVVLARRTQLATT